jgi:mitochondrial fission protein ELM1
MDFVKQSRKLQSFLRKMKVAIFCDAFKKGTFVQIENLVKGLGFEYKYYPIDLPKPWRWLTPFLFSNLPNFLQKKIPCPAVDNDINIIFAGGRQSVLCLFSQDRSKYKKVVFFDPKVSLDNFDLVLAPFHDELPKQNNLIEFLGALTGNFVNDFCEDLKNISVKKPYLSVLIGGNSKHFSYSKEICKKIAFDIKQYFKSNPKFKNGSILVTPSRRTPEYFYEIFSKELEDLANFIWDRKGANPYKFMLLNAEEIIVTTDSITMSCEACSTGKSVLLYDLPIKSKKFKKFYQELIKEKYASNFFALDENFSSKDFKVMNELQRLLPIVKEKLSK